MCKLQPNTKWRSKTISIFNPLCFRLEIKTENTFKNCNSYNILVCFYFLSKLFIDQNMKRNVSVETR